MDASHFSPHPRVIRRSLYRFKVELFISLSTLCFWVSWLYIAAWKVSGERGKRVSLTSIGLLFFSSETLAIENAINLLSLFFLHVNSGKGIRQMNSMHRRKAIRFNVRTFKKLCNFQGEELQQFVQSTCRHANSREIYCTTSSRRR